MSKVKELFTGGEILISESLLDLFSNDECTIENEAEFYHFLRRKLIEVSTQADKAQDFQYWKYVIMRIFECLEKLIKTLKSVKSTRDVNSENVKSTERGIVMMLRTLVDLLNKIQEVQGFVFPYFGDLLELSSNPVILENLILLALAIIKNSKYGDDNINHLIKLSSFLIPFVSVIQDLQWNVDSLRTTLTQVAKETSIGKELPNSLKDLIPNLSEDNQVRITAINDHLLSEMASPSLCSSKLITTICRELNIARNEGLQEYWCVVGEIALVSLLLGPNLNEKIFPLILLSNYFQTSFLTSFEQKSQINEIDLIPLTLSCNQPGLPLNSTIINTILHEVKTLSALKEQQLANKINHIEVLNISLESLILFIRNNELSSQNPTAEICNIIKALFSTECEESSQTKRPFISEIWTIVHTLYKRFYMSIQDEAEGSLEDPAAPLKSRINSLMCLVINLIACIFSKVTKAGSSAETLLAPVKEGYLATIEGVLAALFKEIEVFSFDMNYLSTQVWSAIASLIDKIAPHQMTLNLQIPVKVLKKLKTLVKWSYTQDPQNFFEFTTDKSFLTKLVQTLLNTFVEILTKIEYNYAAKQEYFGYLAYFPEAVLMINNNLANKGEPNRCFSNIQELLIRCYLRVHIEAQLTIPKSNTNELLYCKEDTLAQAWTLISMHYSSFQKSFLPEFEATFKIIEDILKNTSSFPAVLNYHVMGTLYSKCLFHLEVNYTLSSYEHIRTVLVHLYNSDQANYRMLLTNISATLEVNFGALLREAESLDSMYYRNDPGFLKRLLALRAKMMRFAERLILLLGIKQDDRYKELVNSKVLRTTINQSFANLVFSPAFYMVGADNISILTELCIESETMKELQKVALPGYVAKLASISKLLQLHGSNQDAMEDLLSRKLHYLVNFNLDMGGFLADTATDDMKKTYGLNSRLLNVMYLRSIELLEVPFANNDGQEVTTFAEALNKDLMDVVAVGVILTFNMEEDGKQGPIEVNPNVIDDSILAKWTSLPAVKMYFKRKIQILTSLLESDLEEERRRGFARKFSVFYRLHELTSKLNIEDLIEALDSKGTIQSIFEYSMNMLPFKEDFTVNNTEDESTGSNKRSQEFERLYNHVEKAAIGHFSIMNKLFELEISPNNARQEKLNRLQSKYALRTRGILYKALDSYDVELMIQCMTRHHKGEQLNSTRLVNFLYHCCEAILNRIADDHEKIKETKAILKPADDKILPEGEQPSKDQRLKYEKAIYMLLLTKANVLYNSSLMAPNVRTVYRGVFCSYLTSAIGLFDNTELINGSGDPFKFSAVRLQILCSRIIYMNQFLLNNEFTNKAEHNYCLQAIKFFVRTAAQLNSQFDFKRMQEESLRVYKSIFVHIYGDMVVSLTSLTKHLLVSSLNTPSLLSDFKKFFEVLYVSIKNWDEIATATKSTKNLDQGELSVLFYYGLQDLSVIRKLSSDKQMLNILMKYLGRRFYPIVEVFAMYAFDTEKITVLKLRSLAYLDNAIERLVDNNGLKILEKYWPETFKRVWYENIMVKESRDSDNKHVTRRVIPIEDHNVRGRVTVPVNGTPTALSAFSFLREGITEETRSVLDVLIQNIVEDTVKYVAMVEKEPIDYDGLKKLHGPIQNNIGCIGNLFHHFPELSPAVMFHQVNVSKQEDSQSYLALPTGNMIFLSFFIRYACFIYTFEVSHFLEHLIEKNTDEIFVEVEGELLLLTALNELIVFEEILDVLEETTKTPQTFLKSIYSVSIWSILSQTSITLLSLPAERNQKNFKLDIIQKLYTCCLKAIEAHKPNAVLDGETYPREDEIKIVYVFMVRLVQIDMALRAKTQLIQCNDSSSSVLMTPNQLHWAYSFIREQSYSLKEEVPQQLSSQSTFSKIDIRVLRQRTELTGYKPMPISISLSSFFGILHALYVSNTLDYPEIADQRESKQEELKATLYGFRNNFIHSQRADSQEAPPAFESYYKYLYNPIRNSNRGSRSDYLLDNECIDSIPKLFSLDPEANQFKSPLKYIINLQRESNLNRLTEQIRRLLKTETDVENEEAHDSNAQGEGKAASSCQFIKKMGFKKLNEIILENKIRVKEMVQNQQERSLVAKLEAIYNQPISLSDIMAVSTDIDNDKFLNELNELDRNLILLLGSKDFIDSLSLDVQEMSQTVKQAFADAKTAHQNGTEEKVQNDNSSDEDEDAEEEEEEEEEVRRLEPAGERSNAEGVQPQASPTDMSLTDEEDGNAESPHQPDPSDERILVNNIDQSTIEVPQINELERQDRDFGSDVEEACDEEMDTEEKKEVVDEVLELPVETMVKESEDKKDVDQKADSEDGESDEEEHEVASPTRECQEVTDFEKEALLFVDEEEEKERAERRRSITEESETLDIEISVRKETADELWIERETEASQHSTTLSMPIKSPSNQIEIGVNRRDELGYDWLFDTGSSDHRTAEIISFEHLMKQYKDTDSILTKNKILPFPVDTMVSLTSVEIQLNSWVIQSLRLLKSTTLHGKAQSSSNPYRMDTCSLFCRYLTLSLLDSSKEQTLIPVMGLYLVGMVTMPNENLTDELIMRERIIGFLYQYAIRSPSVFLVEYNIKSFKSFLSEGSLMTSDFKTFSVLELLFKFYFIRLAQYGETSDTDRYLLKLINYLLDLRFSVKEKSMPTFLNNLIQSNAPLISPNVQETLFNITEIGFVLTEVVGIKNFCKWLQYLSIVKESRKSVLAACEKILVLQKSIETDVLTMFIVQAKNIFDFDFIAEDNSYFSDILNGITVSTPEVVRVMNHILNQISDQQDEQDLTNFVKDTEVLQIHLNELSLSYMEMLEYASKLVNANILQSSEQLQAKLKTLTKVILQYYWFLSNLKEISADANQPLNRRLTRSKLLRGASSCEVQLEELEAQGSLIKPESAQIHLTLTQWFKKFQELVSSTFEVNTRNQSDFDFNYLVVKAFPWIINFEVKDKLLRNALNERYRSRSRENMTLRIRRDYHLRDTFDEFQKLNFSETTYVFKIQYYGEAGIDAGGLKKEWLTLLAKEIFDPNRGLFKLASNTRTIHPSPTSIILPGVMEDFRFAGTLTGLALRESIPIDVIFSKSFLKLIMGGQPTINDLDDIEPELTRSLRWLLDNDVGDLDQPFSYEIDMFGMHVTQELEENGMSVAVDEGNKRAYISKLALAKTFKEVEKQIESFKKGFFDIIPEDAINVFSSAELAILISGKPEIDVADMKEHAGYEGLEKEDQLVKWFWEIVELMDQNLLANLLFFVTGILKAPYGGFKQSPIVLRARSSDATELPISHTCFRQLDIPPYETKEQLYEKLMIAICEGKEGFHIS